MDEWELRPGIPWQPALEQQIKKIKAAAVFVGPRGLGPWQDIELAAFLRKFVRRKCPVIPVILPDCKKRPKLPTFLEGMTWVDFRKQEPDPLEQLIWGITGQRGSARQSAISSASSRVAGAAGSEKGSRREKAPPRDEITGVTEESLRELPRRAMVALAARCARRVQPLYELPVDCPERRKHVQAIEKAIQVAEAFAKGSVPPGTWEPADAAHRPACVADANAAFSAASNFEPACTAAAAVFQAAFAAWAAGTGNETEAVSRTLSAVQTADTTDTRAAFALGGNALLRTAIVVRAAAYTDLQKLLGLSLGKFPNLGRVIDPGENGPLGPLWPDREPDWYQQLSNG